MVKSGNNDPENGNDTGIDDTWDYTDDGYDDNIYESESDLDDTQSNNNFLASLHLNSVTLIPPPEWKLVKIGETVLHVSSFGKIKPYQSLFIAQDGFAVAGTPYRSYPITFDGGVVKHMYVHEIVWKAFKGHVPDGWEVRHTIDYTKFGRKMYSNAIWNLAIYPKIV